MELATIDPNSHKVQTKLYKIPKFGVNRPNSKQDTAIWKCQNLQRNVWPFGHASGSSNISLLILTFSNGVSQSKLAWLSPNLGILWISVCSFWLCGSIVANPIIYRFVPSPFRLELRQFQLTFSTFADQYIKRWQSLGPKSEKIYSPSDLFLRQCFLFVDCFCTVDSVCVLAWSSHC